MVFYTVSLLAFTLAHLADAAVLKALQKRTLAAAGLPDPHCKSGVVSLQEEGKPQSCCAGYCGTCDDYETCKNVNGQASENACCASKVFEMRCGNAPANVCLKTCSEAVPPCIMDVAELPSPSGFKPYKGIPPCTEVVPFNAKRMAHGITKGSTLADLHVADSELQAAMDTATEAKAKLQKDAQREGLPKELSTKYATAIASAEKVLGNVPKAISKVQDLRTSVDAIKIGKKISDELELKLQGALDEVEVERRDADGVKQSSKSLHQEALEHAAKKMDKVADKQADQYAVAQAAAAKAKEAADKVKADADAAAAKAKKAAAKVKADAEAAAAKAKKEAAELKAKQAAAAAKAKAQAAELQAKADAAAAKAKEAEAKKKAAAAAAAAKAKKKAAKAKAAAARAAQAARRKASKAARAAKRAAAEAKRKAAKARAAAARAAAGAKAKAAKLKAAADAKAAEAKKQEEQMRAAAVISEKAATKVCASQLAGLPCGQEWAFVTDSKNNLVAIKKGPKTGSGKTEVHRLTAASNYKDYDLQTATALHITDDNWDFVMDSKDNLVAILKGPKTGSGKTEVHRMSASSNYQSYDLQTGTGLHYTDENWAFTMDSKDNLVCVLKGPSGSQKTEVHRLSAASNYGSFDLQVGTGLHYTNAASNQGDWDFLMDPQDNLVCILKGPNSGSGKTEVHKLSAASNYKDWNLQTSTAMHYSTAGWAFAMAKNDVVGILKGPTSGSCMTEVHKLNGAANYGQYNLQTGTGLGLSAGTSCLR